MPIIAPPDVLAGDDFPVDIKTQMWLGDSGICLGDIDEFGCRWAATARSAWGSKPAPREEVTDRAFGDGQADSTRFYGPRQIPVPGWVIAPDHGSLHDAERRLREAVSTTMFRLRIAEPGSDGYAMVRQQGEIQWTEVNPRVATFSVGLFAPDPLIYSSNDRSFGPVSFPTLTGGLQWPATWPVTWSAHTVAGEAFLTNPGSVPAPLSLVLTGPARTVTVSLPDLGQSLMLADPDGAPILSAGQMLSVDCRSHQVLLMGVSSRRSWVKGRPSWLALPPRSTTRLTIAGTGVSPVTVGGVTTSPSVSGSYLVARL